VIRYLLADLVRSQRWLPPVLLYLCIAAVLYGGDAGAPRPPYAASAMALLPIAAWLTVVVVNNEDPVQRRVTLAAVGGWRRLLGGLVGSALLCNGVLVVLATLVPPLLNRHHYGSVDVVLGFMAHTISALTGIGLGVLCARPMIPTTGWSLIAVLGGTLTALVANRVPPVGTTAHLLFDSDPPEVVAAVSVQAAIAVAVLAAATTIGFLVGRKRF